MRIKISSHVGRQLKRIKHDEKLLKMIRCALQEIADNPFIGKDLGGELSGILSHRVQNWRILYKVFKKQLLILVVNIGHRKDVYK